MTLTPQAALAQAIKRLKPVIAEAAPQDARRLLAAALNCPKKRLPLAMHDAMHDAMSEEQQQRFEAMINARLAHQPVSQITGEREFWGRSFWVTSDVLDPRPETETLIEAALATGPHQNILDLGTGSGCIALTLLAEWPQATAVAVDHSGKALAVAAENARRLGVAGRVKLRQADWGSGVTGKFDLLVSNPPYIEQKAMQTLQPEVRLWEPRGALCGGLDGLDAYRRIADDACSLLCNQGQGIVEFGKGQGADVRAIFRSQGWHGNEILRDMNNHDRILRFSAIKSS